MQADPKRRLAEAEAAVVDGMLRVRRQREEVADLKRAGKNAEAAQAQAALEILEDSLRRRIGERDTLQRASAGSSDDDE